MGFLVEAEWVSGTVTLAGCSLVRPFGVVVNRLGNDGTTAANWAATNALRDAAVAALGAQTHIMMLGTNDQTGSVPPSSFYTSYVTIIDRLRAATANCDIIVSSSPHNLRTGMAIGMEQYRDAAKRVAFDRNACSWT